MLSSMCVILTKYQISSRCMVSGTVVVGVSLDFIAQKATSSVYANTYREELYDTVTLMFFFRNKHMMCDFGTGNNNKLNWVLEDKQELIDIIETIYKGAKKGRGLVVSPKDYSTRYRY
jgi:Mitosis protein DIM1